MSVYSEYGSFHHSTLSNGEPVAFAGEITIEKGEIKTITNGSGHYKCPFEMVENVKVELKTRGVNIDNIQFIDVNP